LLFYYKKKFKLEDINLNLNKKFKIHKLLINKIILIFTFCQKNNVGNSPHVNLIFKEYGLHIPWKKSSFMIKYF